MRTFAIGDIHGCSRTLDALMRQLAFDVAVDRLWFVGDLVNRGPDSLGVLRRVAQLATALGDRLRLVLGNHDLHLLALAHQLRPAGRDPDLEAVLAAPDRDFLLEWLGGYPLFLHEGTWVLVHAGLLPQWSLADAAHEAARVKRLLASSTRDALLRRETRRGEADSEAEDLREDRVALAAFTRLRVCDAAGGPIEWTGVPELAPPPGRAWHAWRLPSRDGVTFVCGHWAAQGLVVLPHLVALDGGCAWGGPLAAIELTTRRVFLQANLDQRRRSGRS